MSVTFRFKECTLTSLTCESLVRIEFVMPVLLSGGDDWKVIRKEMIVMM